MMIGEARFEIEEAVVASQLLASWMKTSYTPAGNPV
jgi:hypothetical protein